MHPRSIHLWFLLPWLACSSDAPKPGADAGCPARASGQRQDKVERYVPGSNEVPGWAEDTAIGQPGVEAGYSYDEIVAIIDGSQEPYAQAGCVGFAKQDYKKGSFTLNLLVWQMKDTAAAQTIFEKNRAALESEGITDGAAISCLDDAGVIGSDRMMLKGYARKSEYAFKFVSRCDATAELPTLRAEVIGWVKALAAKLP
jgi:hypothetical protein